MTVLSKLVSGLMRQCGSDASPDTRVLTRSCFRVRTRVSEYLTAPEYLTEPFSRRVSNCAIPRCMVGRWECSAIDGDESHIRRDNPMLGDASNELEGRHGPRDVVEEERMV